MESRPSQSDLTACSICFEKFRTPRCLPCSHMFCHSCLSSYIVTSCESKEAPIGFSCPLCREFIPSPVLTDKPENWTEKFPVCEILEKCNNLRDSGLCSSCQRGNEDEEATNICLTCQDSLCVVCTKCHRQNRASCTHKIIPIDDPNAVIQLTTTLLKIDNCQEHPDRKVELYCNDHSKACCTLCVSTEHRKCESINDIQRATEKIKTSDNFHALQEELGNYEAKLLKTKKSQEDNLIEIDNSSDLITEETQKLKKEIIEHLDKLESKHQNELSRVMKESREMLNKSIDSLSDRIQFTRHCVKSLEEVTVETGATFMEEYHKIKGHFEMLKKQNASTKELKIESNAAKELEKIKNAILLSNLHVTKSQRNRFTDLDLLSAHFSLLYDFYVPNLKVYVCSGTFIPDGTFIIANNSRNKIGLTKYSLTNNNWTLLKTVQSSSHLFDIRCVENELYVTDCTNEQVIVISDDTFTTVRDFSVEQNPYGIAIWGKFLFLACETAILKYDIHGNLIHSYPLENRVLYLVVMDNGHIVFSNMYTHNVTAMDDQGKTFWKYSSPKLRTPHSVDKDKMNNIYVAGTDSNNIHILSCNGNLIRIVEDIPKPAFMKVKEGSNICCVCSDWKNIRVYEIK